MTELWRLGAAEIAGKVRAGEVSALEVTEQVLSRLSAANPRINAVVQEFPEAAIEEARKRDEDIARGISPGVLAGVPVTVKVTVDQAGCASTNGLRIQKDHVAELDSPVVANLRQAGAVIVGRTNTPAFSMRWFTRNSLHGHTLNPRNPALTPGGSSGGAAAATAAGIGAIGHGTDIAGSIRYPAYACGLHGLRPTPGRVPAVNLSLPDRHIGSQLSAVSGPVARSVEDIRLGFHAMSAASDLDPWWVPVSHELGGYRKAAVLCPRPDGMETSEPVAEALCRAARHLERSGWRILETPAPPLREAAVLQLRLWFSEFALDRGQSIRNENDPDALFVYEQGMALLDRPISLESLMEALQRRVALAREWQRFLAEHTLLLCPVSAEPPFPDMLDVRSPEDFRSVFEAQMTQVALPFMGVPAMSVCTVGGRVPLGVQLVAARFREDILMEAAAVIEAASGAVGIADD
ncbi:MAG: amidase family protein [Gammaproteobacteria bacterium]|nr:amidase family protein [Gammaproteobacteria bacterium]MYD77061.1 amidase family protein [Gammaproteobacteria bacterium]MYJ52242.1 amidase family protein [Gammaproteobacteria bacterium]